MARDSPDRLADALGTPEWAASGYPAAWDQHIDIQREVQPQAREMPFRLRPDELWASPHPTDSDPDAWLGLSSEGRVEAWRYDSANYFWWHLRNNPTYAQSRRLDTTTADFVAPAVDLSRLRADRRSYNTLWFEDIKASDAVRSWLRWAVRFGQLNYRISHGNPGDEQQSAYLPDADHYVTADRRFGLLLQSLRPYVPAPIASVEIVGRDAGSAVGEIARVLAV